MITVITRAREPAPPQHAPNDPPAAPPIDGDWQDVTNEEQAGEQSNS